MTIKVFTTPPRMLHFEIWHPGSSSAYLESIPLLLTSTLTVFYFYHLLHPLSFYFFLRISALWPCSSFHKPSRCLSILFTASFRVLSGNNSSGPSQLNARVSPNWWKPENLVTCPDPDILEWCTIARDRRRRRIRRWSGQSIRVTVRANIFLVVPVEMHHVHSRHTYTWKKKSTEWSTCSAIFFFPKTKGSCRGGNFVIKKGRNCEDEKFGNWEFKIFENCGIKSLRNLKIVKLKIHRLRLWEWRILWNAWELNKI